MTHSRPPRRSVVSPSSKFLPGHRTWPILGHAIPLRQLGERRSTERLETGEQSMNIRRLSATCLALALTIGGAMPIARADDPAVHDRPGIAGEKPPATVEGGLPALFNYSDQSHAYCPRGGRMYWGLLGYWCEDSTLSGTRPIDCTSGPGQPVGTWNNGSMTPEQLCTQPGSYEVYGRTGL